MPSPEERVPVAIDAIYWSAGIQNRAGCTYVEFKGGTLLYNAE
ncbi:MAG: hypothetical protein OJF50_003298 [Nitrospira sp.]|nr:hypothetical protein [Nitrospira sp.]